MFAGKFSDYLKFIYLKIAVVFLKNFASTRESLFAENLPALEIFAYLKFALFPAEFFSL